MTERRAIVLAGGQGTRLRPYTAVIPKPLMPVGDRPVLDIVIRQLCRCGFDRVTIATGFLAELVEAFFGDGTRYGLRIDYFREEEPLGTVGALAYMDDLDGPFLVMNGDVLTDLDFGALLDRHAQSDSIGTIAVTTQRIDVSLGVLQVDERETDRVAGYVEKPSIDVDASMGVYCFSPAVRDHVGRGEHLDFPDLVLRLLDRGEIVRTWRPDAYWLDIGRHDDHELAVREFERNRSRFVGEDEPLRALGDVAATTGRAGFKAVGVDETARRPHVLVTGGAGFIGSNLVDALLATGATVAVVDSLVTGRRDNVDPRARLHVADVSDADALERVFGRERPSIVFHLAGQLDVRRSMAEPAFDVDVNVRGTAAVLEAARVFGVDRVVHASTGGALYGDAAAIPTAESAPVEPMSPYGASKAAAEAYCSLYTRVHGLSTVSLRLANVYGPRQDPQLETGVVAQFCAAALNGGRACVFGDGRQTRDFIHVSDVVTAFVAAADSRVAGAFNVGTGVETSIVELAEALELERIHAPARQGEVLRSCLDPSAAVEHLSWQPTIALADGLSQTLQWTEAHLRAQPQQRSALRVATTG
jgi:nucleoside-diphosphate-sugar epimerase/NDP-sugar pyrophosphorylase family protein